ncbi:MAG: S-layer homology domain-containing protein [Clostridia bacterium]|nr:S-layer homology domain-containing protein [Clostridia bacterium]
MKRFFVVLMVSVMLAVGASAAFERVNTYNNNFSDVTDSNWYAENVKTAYELGFMNGKSEGKFDPNGNVTVAEGITMAARIHAIYNGIDIDAHKKVVEEYGFTFEDGKVPTAYNRATGYVEDGVLIVQPDKPNSIGAYDPQVSFNKLSFSASDYNLLKFRMKIEPLDNTDTSKPRNEVLQFYFMTNLSSGITADKVEYVKLKELGKDLTDWFEVEVELAGNPNWTDTITGFRFDPSDDNGIFHIDYITFSKSENATGQKWYQKYVDYATDYGLYGKNDFTSADMTRNITRAEMCNLIASAVPEEEFVAINDVKGIPDVLRDARNADVYLMLYKAGIVLGDTEGNFKPASDIKRSEIAAIINRVALPENRVKGTTNTDWAEQGNEYDVEFNSPDDLARAVPGDCDFAEIKNGAITIVPTDRGENRSPQFDPKLLVSNIKVDAGEFAKLKVRMKVDFKGDAPAGLKKFDFYFKTEGDESLSEAKSMHQAFTEYSYLDAAGWYVMEVDFTLHKEWKGNIVEFRFDPANTDGIYTIDYIRLAKGDPLHGASHDVLINEGYTATRLMQDEHFERGFGVDKVDQTAPVKGYKYGTWQYNEGTEAPLWGIGPWWQGTGEGFTPIDLWPDRDTTADKYTLTDKYGANTITYNPETKSITMRQNATKIYNGKPHDKETYKWWPHLLLEQSTALTGEVDKVRNSAAADRTFFEIDVRMNDYKPTTNPDGTNVASYLVYFYLVTDKAPGQRIWFGFQLFVGESGIDTVTPSWSPDSAANQYMYGIRQADIYDGLENSFNPEKGVVTADGEWRHVRMDITSHIKRAVEWANRDNIFGTEVTVEDMYWNGVNIGFETHGNYDYEFEFKNFNMVSYDKAE